MISRRTIHDNRIRVTLVDVFSDTASHLMKLDGLVRQILPALTAFAILFTESPIRAQETPATLGIFESHADIGVTPNQGSATYDTAASEYRVTGGGANMWAGVDAFHFVWKKVDGDFDLSAVVTFVGTGAEDHRKAALVVRQSLDPKSTYADVALHGDGLTSLQFRPVPGAETSEVRSPVKAPAHLS